MTERLHFHFSLSCIGEGNGNPLQCSCLDNPRDGGALWAAVYGVPPYRVRGSSLATGQYFSSFIPTLFLTCLSLLPVCHSTLSTPEPSSQRKGPQARGSSSSGKQGEPPLTVGDFQQGPPILRAQRLKYGFKLNTSVYNNRVIQS